MFLQDRTKLLSYNSYETPDSDRCRFQHCNRFWTLFIGQGLRHRLLFPADDLRTGGQAQKGPQISVNLKVHPAVAKKIDYHRTNHIGRNSQAEAPEKWILGNAKEAISDTERLPEQCQKHSDAENAGLHQDL